MSAPVIATIALLAAAQPGVDDPLQALEIPGLPQQPDIADPLDRIEENAPPDAATVDADAAAVPIVGVTFTGVDAPAPVAEAARPFIGRPASTATLRELATALSDAYAKTDIALYTVAIPEQNLSDGVVEVLLAEGQITSIDFPNGASPLVRAYGANMEAAVPLTRKVLERNVSLIRDIPGAKADVSFKRGEGAGGVALSIATQRRRSEFSSGFNNMGQRGLGRAQLSATAKLYSLLRDGEGTVLSLAGSTSLSRYRQASLSHSTPLGSNGLRLGLSGVYLETKLKNPEVRGEAYAAGVSLSHPVIRGYRTNLTATLGLDGLNSDAALLATTVTSDRTRAARASLIYSDIGRKGVLTARGTASRGVDILGARTTAGLSETEFTKLAATLGYDRQIGRRLVVRTEVGGQYSRDLLPSNERFVVGGMRYGRGFDTSYVSGDRGIGGSLELALRPQVAERLRGSEVFAFVDGARLHREARLTSPDRTFDLASAGGGVRVALNPFARFDLEAARVIDRPFPDETDKWRFNVRYVLKLQR